MGSVFSGLMGFVLTFVLARLLGGGGAGVVLQVMAVFMIGLSLSRVGLDTALVWYLPRSVDEDQHDLRPILTVAVIFAGLAGLVVAAAVWVVAPLFAPEPELRTALRTTAPLIPVASMFLVALAGTRAIGGIKPYIVIGSIIVPVARPILLIVAVSITASTTLASLVWSAPYALGLVLALGVLLHQVGRHERRGGRRGRGLPRRGQLRELLGFAAPRVASTAMEQTVVWLDVLLVGAIAGAAAAGVYGSAARFLSAALLIDTALRTVVSPAFSRLLWRRDLDRLRTLFTRTTTWLVLLSSPISVMLFAFAPLILGWLGPEFVEGSSVMRILAVGICITLGAGNVHSLLLMSGRSNWAALNKAVVLVVNVCGNLIFIPVAGIEAAAVVWSTTMAIDAVMATVEVRRFERISARAGSVALAYVIGIGPLALVAAASIFLLGQSIVGLVVTCVVGAAAYGSVVYAARRHLHLDELASIRRPTTERD